jgi:rhodanese-related sulfurtransferase
MSVQDAVGYAGDVKAVDAFQLLTEKASAVLVDVRTKAEWAYVGVPDLKSIDKAPVLIEWQTFPGGQVDLRFVDRLAETLAEAGVARGAPLIFLCRSGARSRSAALAMTESGWGPCLNVSDGFEGPLDSSGHRNAAAGWRASGLPWKQT